MRAAKLTCYFNLFVALLSLAQSTVAQSAYSLKATPKTVAWGYYDAKGVWRIRCVGCRTFCGFCKG
jgi:hypothetical protein